MARLELMVLGGFAARLGGRPVRLPGRKARALLAYLALRPGQAHAREHLAALLWGEADDARARDSLRHALATLRTALGDGRPSALVDDRETVALRVGAVDVDAARFERLVAQAAPRALERAATLYTGDLLDGVDGDEGPFREWLLAERARLRELAVASLSRLLAHQTRRSATGPAVRTAARLLALDPTDEAAHRALMRLHAAEGRRGAALRQYLICVNVLSRELGTEPEPETRALYRELLRASPDAVAAQAKPRPRTSRVAARPRSAAFSGERPPIVGRDAEVASLRAALDAATRGEGRVIVLVGEAGVGKTRLVAALAEEAAARDARLLVGGSHESEQILPFGPWVDALRASGVGAEPRALDGLGRAWRTELIRLLPEIGPRSAASLPSGRDPLRLFEAVARFVELLTVDRPAVIVLEDLHWADDMSVRLFAFLARRAAPLRGLLLATVREEDLATKSLVGRVLEEIRREAFTTVLTVAPLDRQDTMTLVRALARPGTPPSRLNRLGERIWRLSEGNPFVVTEAMRAAEAGGMRDEAASLSVPSRVRDLIAARLDGLGEHSRAVAQIAAIGGRELDFCLLCRASRLEDAQAADAVEELVRARILHGVDEQLSFVHERIREVVLGQLPAPRRILLHRQVAESLEAAQGSDPEPYVGALARHYREGEVWPKAVEYLTRFAEQAARRYAVDDAVAALREARNLVGRLPASERDRRHLDLALRLAHCLYFLGRHDEGRRLLLAEEDRLARTGDPAHAGRYHFLLARSASLAGDHEEAERHARQVLENAERAGDAQTLGQAHYLLAHEAYWTGRSREGVEHAERAIALLERSGERWWLGHAWWILCVNLGLLGQFGPALDAARRTDAIGQALGDQRLQSYAAWSTSWVQAARGEPEASIEGCRRALELAPDPVSRMNARQALGYSWIEAGHADRAIAELEPVVAELSRLGVRRPHGLFTAYLAEAYRLAGRLEHARTAATGALAATRALGYGYATGLALRTLGRIALDEDDRTGARTWLEDAIEGFVAIGARFEEARTRLDLVTAHHGLGQGADAAREAEAARDLFRVLDVPRYVERAGRLAAELASRRPRTPRQHGKRPPLTWEPPARPSSGR
jgi:DNA-binding SARP family transcriptional activator/tetratricopeptide (TPR) repeat protein